MPLTLKVGLSQKIGLPDYGSLGASCHIELELGSHLLERSPDLFQQEVRAAFAACRQAVEEELASERGQRAAVPSGTSERRRPHVAWHPGPSCQPITARQLDYVRRLAAQIEELGPHDLETLVAQMFERSLADLSSHEASNLIDTLRQIKSGQQKLEEVVHRIAA